MKIEQFNIENLVNYLFKKSKRKKDMVIIREVYSAQEMLKDDSLSDEIRKGLIDYIEERVGKCEKEKV